MRAGFVSLGLAPRLAKTEAAIGDRLPYARHLDDATIETRDGMLLQVIKIAGFPFETADDQELNYRKQVRESLLKALASSRLTLYHHVVRRRFTPRFGRLPEDAFSRSLEEGWRETLTARRLFVNDLYLTLVLRPALGRSRWLDSLTRGRGQDAAAQATALRQLNLLRNSVMATLAPYGPHCLTRYKDARGEASEPCAFLAQLVNGELRRMITPGGDIGQALADRRLTFGLDAMEISAAGALPRQFAAMVSFKDYPARSTPGLLDGVLRLPCELVMTESFTFADRQVEVKTGTIQVASLFPNPRNILRPGQFARVRAATTIKRGALLVPQRAVGDIQGRKVVAVVKPDNTVEIRPVKPAETIGTQWVIDEGLKPGERVVAEGILKVRPGSKVNPRPFAEAPAAAGR